MKTVATYALTCLLLAGGTYVSAQSSRKPSKPPAEDRPKPAAPKKYENAENKFRFEAPDTWQSVGGGCPGSIYNLAISPDFASLPKGKPGETVRFHGDLMTVAANPASSADAELAATVSELQTQIKKDFPAAEFKPIEKAKVGGVDASVLTATMPSKTEGEPKLVHRHTVFQRDGKVFQIILYAHANTIAKQTTAVQKVVKSFQWTEQPAATAAGAPDRNGPAASGGAFNNAEHGLRLQLPPEWDAGESSIPGSIATFFPPGDADGHVDLFARDPQGKDADGILTALQGEVRDHDANAKFDPIQDAKLGGEPARMFTYHVKLGETEKSCQMLASLHAGKAYVIMYGAPPAEYEKNVGAVKRLADSFRWTTQGSNKTPATRPAAH